MFNAVNRGQRRTYHNKTLEGELNCVKFFKQRSTLYQI